jgi:hypothetical protein
MDLNYDENVISHGNHLISYGDANFIKNVICWIADNGQVNQYLKTELSRKKQQEIINLCKDIKIKFCW